MVNIKRVETEILSSPDFRFRYLLPHPLIQHMKTLVYVYSFLEIKHILYIYIYVYSFLEIKHILYIIEIELLQR